MAPPVWPCTDPDVAPFLDLPKDLERADAAICGTGTAATWQDVRWQPIAYQLIVWGGSETSGEKRDREQAALAIAKAYELSKEVHVAAPPTSSKQLANLTECLQTQDAYKGGTATAATFQDPRWRELAIEIALDWASSSGNATDTAALADVLTSIYELAKVAP